MTSKQPRWGNLPVYAAEVRYRRGIVWIAECTVHDPGTVEPASDVCTLAKHGPVCVVVLRPCSTKHNVCNLLYSLIECHFYLKR